MSHLDLIYAPWDGNAEEMARAINELGVTVRQWRNRGRIPERYWLKIIGAAAEKGALLRVENFMPDMVPHANSDSAAGVPVSPDKPGDSIGEAA